jgi:hypothetical protein
VTTSLASLRRALATATLGVLLALPTLARADVPEAPPEPLPDLPPAPASPPAPAPPHAGLAERPTGPTAIPTFRSYGQRSRATREWYGWQTLIADGAWIVGASASGAGNQGGVAAAFVLSGYLVAPPVIHFANGEIGRGFADLGIRVGAPLALGLVGFAAFSGGPSPGNDGIGPGAVGAILGAGLGMLVAVVLDASVLAYRPVGDEDALRAAPRRHARVPATMTPFLAPRREGGAVFGLSGAL